MSKINYRFDAEAEMFLMDVPEAMKANSTLVKFKVNDLVFKKSEKTEYAYVLLKGELLVSNEFVDGNYYTFSTLTPFTYLSDLECLSGEMRNAATVVASKESILLRFSIDDFAHYLKKDPKFLFSVASSLSRKIYFTSYERGKNLYKTGIDKVINYLVTYCQINDMNSNNIITIKRTREMIASEIGISIKTVNRSIYELENNGFVSISKGKVNISYEQYNQLFKLNNKNI